MRKVITWNSSRLMQEVWNAYHSPETNGNKSWKRIQKGEKRLEFGLYASWPHNSIKICNRDALQYSKMVYLVTLFTSLYITCTCIKYNTRHQDIYQNKYELNTII